MVVETSLLEQISKLMHDGRYSEASKEFVEIADALEGETKLQNFIFSCEDLSGNLLGRRQEHEVYPNLSKNIELIECAFRNFKLEYFFFLRNKSDWLHSVYKQNVKYRSDFSSFPQFREFVQFDGGWRQVVQASKDLVGDRLHLIPYSKDDGDTVVERFRHHVPCLAKLNHNIRLDYQANVSPSDDQVRLFELVNRSTCSEVARQECRDLLLNRTGDENIQICDIRSIDRFNGAIIPDNYESRFFSPLLSRALRRVHSQKQIDVMPDDFSTIQRMRFLLVDGPDKLPETGRQKMEDQVEILRFRFRGFPYACFLLGLSISYLRRETEYTAKASRLFQYLWMTEFRLLLCVLPTRWLISSLQTFMEFGVSENQRRIGGSGYFFSNMLKIYEAERALEGLESDSIYPNVVPSTKPGVVDLDQFPLGGTDLMLNTVALLFEVSSHDPVAGRVLQEILARVKKQNSVFSRMDQSRLFHDIDIHPFTNCWSFFEKPSK